MNKVQEILAGKCTTVTLNFLGKTYRARFNSFFGKFLLEKDTETGFKNFWWPSKQKYLENHGMEMVNGIIRRK